jgi:hypothetical protein
MEKDQGGVIKRWCATQVGGVEGPWDVFVVDQR